MHLLSFLLWACGSVHCNTTIDSEQLQGDVNLNGITVRAAASDTGQPIPSFLVVAYPESVVQELSGRTWHSIPWIEIDSTRVEGRSQESGIVTLKPADGPYCAWILSASHTPIFVHLTDRPEVQTFWLSPTKGPQGAPIILESSNYNLEPPCTLIAECRPLLTPGGAEGSALFQEEWLCRLRLPLPDCDSQSISLPVFPDAPWIQALSATLGTYPQRNLNLDIPLLQEWRPLVETDLATLPYVEAILRDRPEAQLLINAYASNIPSGTSIALGQASIPSQQGSALALPASHDGWLQIEVLSVQPPGLGQLYSVRQASKTAALLDQNESGLSSDITYCPVVVQDAHGFGISNCLVSCSSTDSQGDKTVLFQSFSDSEGKLLLPVFDAAFPVHISACKRGFASMTVPYERPADMLQTPEEPVRLTLYSGRQLDIECTYAGQPICPTRIFACALNAQDPWMTEFVPYSSQSTLIVPSDVDIAVYCLQDNLSPPRAQIVRATQQSALRQLSFAFSDHQFLKLNIISSDPSECVAGASVVAYPILEAVGIAEVASSTLVAADGSAWLAPPPAGRIGLVVSAEKHKDTYKYLDWPDVDGAAPGTLVLQKYASCQLKIKGLDPLDDYWELLIEGASVYYQGELPEDSHVLLSGVVPGEMSVFARSSKGIELLSTLTMNSINDTELSAGFTGNAELCLLGAGSDSLPQLDFVTCQTARADGGRWVVTAPIEEATNTCIPGMPSGPAILEWADGTGNVRYIDQIVLERGTSKLASPTTRASAAHLLLTVDGQPLPLNANIGMCLATKPPSWERAFLTDATGAVHAFWPSDSEAALIMIFFDDLAFFYPAPEALAVRGSDPVSIDIKSALVHINARSLAGEIVANTRISVIEPRTGYSLGDFATDELGICDIRTHIDAKLLVQVDSPDSWPAPSFIDVTDASVDRTVRAYKTGSLVIRVAGTHPGPAQVYVYHSESASEVGNYGPAGTAAVRAGQPLEYVSPGQHLLIDNIPEGEYIIRHQADARFCKCSNPLVINLSPGTRQYIDICPE